FFFLFHVLFFSLFFFHHTATPALYTLSLHDALPISLLADFRTIRTTGLLRAIHSRNHNRAILSTLMRVMLPPWIAIVLMVFIMQDRKSTRLNSSHDQISYAVFCLKKKKKKKSIFDVT